MSRELLPQTVKLTASELCWLAGSGVVVLNFCSATMYGLRIYLWSIGLVRYTGHPQPPQSYWARVYCGCQPGPTRVALHPGRMMEKPERQPYIHWTTCYDFEETRNIELCSYTFAKIFGIGQWSFTGPRSEKKWYPSENSPQGAWDHVAEDMLLKFEESGHPIFRSTTPLSRGKLKRKRESVHTLQC